MYTTRNSGGFSVNDVGPFGVNAAMCYLVKVKPGAHI
jgi:hypothetical protein